MLTLTTVGSGVGPPLENDPLLEQQFPGCHWTAASDGEMRGEVYPNPAAEGLPASVGLFGSVHVSCPSPADGGQLVVASIAFSASGFRQ